MHFSSSVFCKLIFFLNFLLVVSAFGQDSLSKQLDSLELKKTSEMPYKNLIYVSGFTSTSLNNYFYDDYYKSGMGIQLGVPLYSHNYYTLRFNLAYSSYKFQMEEYLKTDTLKEMEEVKGTPLQIATFLPDIIIHPLPNYLISPYLNVGFGMMVGSNQVMLNKNMANGKVVMTEKAFGSRYLAQVGLGGIISVLPFLNVIAGASYNIEFLRNHSSDDIFYKFKTRDESFKYMNYSVGIQLKFKK